ncbi:MAG: leucine-rich repeat domain-containing protein [Bacilli bacterium]|nr:leucine-rich repeat domain-containing protein [Bacilli bacterium]
MKKKKIFSLGILFLLTSYGVSSASSYSYHLNNVITPTNNDDVCMITFNAAGGEWEDGSTEKVVEVASGTLPQAPEVNPYKAPSTGYNYEFAGWLPTISLAFSDTTYYASYQIVQQDTFTVTWANYDGTVLETDTNVPYGSAPSYDGAEPTRPEDADKEYFFNGWGKLSPVTSDVTYTAQYYDRSKHKTKDIHIECVGCVTSFNDSPTYHQEFDVQVLENSDVVFKFALNDIEGYHALPTDVDQFIVDGSASTDYTFDASASELHFVVTGNTDIKVTATDDAEIICTYMNENPTSEVKLECESTGDIKVNWGDDATMDTSLTHTYNTAGTFDISLYGDISKIKLSNADGPLLPDNIYFTKVVYRNYTSFFNSPTTAGIDANAFKGITHLTEVALPILPEMEGKTAEIGADAFSGCTSLSSFKIPPMINQISTGVFSGCISLTSLIVHDNNLHFTSRDINGAQANYIVSRDEDTATLLYGCDDVDFELVPGNHIAIADSAFAGCALINEVKFTSKVNKLGTLAFANCHNLVSIVNEAPDLLEYPSQCFSGCDSLTDIDFGHVTKIGASAFAGCTSLADLELGHDIQEIGESAFKDCTDLIVANFVMVGRPDNESDPFVVPTIAATAFDNCPSLVEEASFLVPSSGQGGPEYDARQEYINNLGENAKYIYRLIDTTKYNFAKLAAFATVYFDTGLSDEERHVAIHLDYTRVPEFEGTIYCNWGDGNEDVVDISYRGQTGLTFNLEHTFTNAGDYCIRIYVPSSHATRSVLGEVSFAANDESGELYGLGNKHITSFVYPFAYTPEMFEYLPPILVPSAVRNMPMLHRVVLPHHLSSESTVLEKTVFQNSAIKSLTLSHDITAIQDQAFMNCASLEKIVLPTQLTSINRATFTNCTALERVVMNKNLIFIDDNAFASCTNLKVVDLRGVNANQVVSLLGGEVFTGCPLEKILVPAKLLEQYKTDPQWGVYANIITLE